MNKDYDNKHLLDLTSPQEPIYDDFSIMLDKDKFYQVWSEQTETSIEEKEAYYGNQRPF